MIPQSFDGIGAAILTLFELTTTEAWVDVMLAAVDSTEIGMQPVVNNKPHWCVMFILFEMLGSFVANPNPNPNPNPNLHARIQT